MRALLCWLLVVFLPFLKTNAQTTNYNFDFEHWHIDSLGQDRLDQWEHIAWNYVVREQLHGTKKSTQSHAGNYAVTVHRWYIVDKDALRLKQAIAQKPTFLNGSYTYTDAVLAVHPDSAAINDIATVTAYFTKWNNILNRPDTIGYGYQELSAAAGYTPFSCAITYTAIDQPDSFSVYIWPTKFFVGLGCKNNPDCSFLTVDDLSFATTAAVRDVVADKGISLYPNPARQELFIKALPGVVVHQVRLVDVMGRTVLSREGAIQKIDLEHLSPGSYFLQLQTNKGPVVKKIVVE